MDEFAQTGAQQDDLFDDVQYEESMQTRQPDDLFHDDFEPIAQPIVEAPAPPPTGPARGNGRNRGRGNRGRFDGPRKEPNRNNPATAPTTTTATTQEVKAKGIQDLKSLQQNVNETRTKLKDLLISTNIFGAESSFDTELKFLNEIQNSIIRYQLSLESRQEVSDIAAEQAAS